MTGLELKRRALLYVFNKEFHTLQLHECNDYPKRSLRAIPQIPVEKRNGPSDKQMQTVDLHMRIQNMITDIRSSP